MRCLDANDVVRFLDGDEVDPAFEDHVDGCPDCRALVTELGRAIEVPEPARGSQDGTWEVYSGAEVVDRGSQVDRYVVLDAIGAGAMGVVYRAYDPELDRDIALKLVRVLGVAASGEQARSRLLREAQTMAKLSHPNIVTVYDASIFGSHVFVAMELVEGVDLEAYLARRPLPWREIARLFVAAGRGLAAAHAAGIVHRDFKPSNVLVGDDGRVRVTDFGLAVSTGAAEAGSIAVGSSRLTEDGTLIGTPAYMSPEVRAGNPADERSDQFSFAVALCEAISGERTPSAKLPGALRAIITRGLAPAPEARYPTTAAMIDALERALSPRLRRAMPFAALGLGAIAVTGYLATARSDERVSCTAPADRLAGVWDPARKVAIRDAFTRSQHPQAAAQWQKVETALDRFSSAWTTSHVAACEATHVRREQSGELLDRRMACLQAELGRLTAVTDMFAAADRDVVARAARAAELDDHLARCNDLTALRAAVPLPANPALRMRAAVATNELARVETISLRGKFADAITGARHVIGEAVATGDLRLEADATRSLGETQWRAGHYADAIQNLYKAVDAAKRAHALDLEAGALLDLVAVLFEEARYAEALQVARLAESAVQASGDDERLAKLVGNRAAVHYAKGDYAAAKVDYERALKLFERINGPAHRTVGQSLHNLAMLAAETDPAGSLPLYDRAKTVLEKALAPRHPEVALLLANRSIALANVKRFEDAMRDLALALDIRRAILGSDHRDTTGTIVLMGQVELEAGKHAAALARFREALAAFETTLPADHPERAQVLSGIGRAHAGAGKPQDARTSLEQALAIWERNQLETTAVAEARFALARVLWPRERARALDLARRARTGFAGAPDQAAQVDSWLEGKR